MKYAWIREHRDSFPVAVLCEVLQVSASGYYAWQDREPSPRAERHEQIRQAVRQVHAESEEVYGSYKIARELADRPELESACRNTVAQAMRELGLKSRIRRTFTPTTTQADPTQQPAPNYLAQDFTAEAPNRKWVTDITYLPTAEGWVYLAVVLDLFSRKVVGWALGNSLATELVSAALRQAVESLAITRGRDYTSICQRVETFSKAASTSFRACSFSARFLCKALLASFRLTI